MSRAKKPEACPPEEYDAERAEDQEPTAEAVLHALIGTAHVIDRAFDARLADQKLPVKLSGPRLHILIAVERAKRLRMGDVAAALGITPRTVTTLVDGVERDGLLKRVLDPSDRRATLLELTAMAREHFARVHTLHRQLSEEVTAALDEDQCRQLLYLLNRLRAGVTTSPNAIVDAPNRATSDE